MNVDEVLRQRLAQLEAENESLTQRLHTLAGVQAEAVALRNVVAELREEVIPDYQIELAAARAGRAELAERLRALGVEVGGGSTSSPTDATAPDERQPPLPLGEGEP